MESVLNINHHFQKRAIPSRINLYVVGVHSFPIPKPSLSGVISTPDWAIEYHTDYSGEIHFLRPGAKKPVQKERRDKNTVHLYKPKCSFREDSRQGAFPRQETYMYFKGGDLCGFSKFIENTYGFCRFLDTQNKIGSILKKAAFLCSSQGDNAFWEVQSLFDLCISILLNHSRKISRNNYEIFSRNQMVDPFTETVEKYIWQNISQTITNSEMACHMNLSESSFNHKFKNKIGVSPKAKVLEIKMDVAKSLLLKGKKLKEISEFIGFYDEFHLSKTFKKVTGVSPSEFRLTAVSE